jgi:hypothetical protein
VVGCIGVFVPAILRCDHSALRARQRHLPLGTGAPRKDEPVVATDLLSTIETLIPLLARKDRAVADDLRAQSDRLDLSVHGGYGDPKRVTQSVGREVRRILACLEA